ncbi:MAG: ABC transporter ATP-binding protein [Christensenellales bacterium]
MEFNQEQEYTKQLDLKIWKKILHYARPYYKNILYLGIFMGALALTDAIFPLLSEYAIDNIIMTGELHRMAYFIPVYLALSVFSAYMIYSFFKQSGKIEVGTCHNIREVGIKKLQELSFTFYDRTPVGYLLARMTSDAQRLADMIGWGTIDLVWGFAMMVIALVIMLIKNWQLALLVSTVVPALAVISVFFQKHILAAYRNVRRINSQITGAFNEGIMGAKTTKTLVLEEHNFGEFKELTGEMKKSSVRAAMLSAIYMPIITSIASLAAGLALWRGGYQVYLGQLSLGEMTVFLSYAIMIFEPIRELARTFADFQSAQAAAERVIGLIETEPDIVDSPEVIEKYGDQINPIYENWEPIKGDVEFENVTFNYKGGEKVLENFNLNIKSGQTIALVGETGSGKSTIINLVCRFYEPTRGCVKIDGVDYRQRSQLWLQSRLGYVLQSPHLFSGSIKDNIRYGLRSASDEDVIEAAKMVGAHKFITGLEKGYDTDVGEGGSRLSTGEKQLISFARAIIADPAIFVLDEATSSIDTETEALIQKAIDKVLEGRTSFIVAHRLSTIRNADRILVIQDGKITEDGNHRQLLAKKGYYYNLYTNQFQDEQIRSIMQETAEA